MVRRGWIPTNEYRKRQREFKKARAKEQAKRDEEERQRKEAWLVRGRRLTQAKKEHPVKYFFGTTDTQQEIFGKVSVANKVVGLGKVTDSNHTETTGMLPRFVTTLVVLIVFFPLLLLSHPRQLRD